MAFKSVNIVGDGSSVQITSNSLTVESVINSAVVYNTTGSNQTVTIQIDGNDAIVEVVSANSRFVLDTKVNMPADSTVTCTVPTGVNVLISFYEQAIDIAAGNTVLQQYLADIESALDTFDGKYLGGKASEPTAGNSGEPLVGGMLYYNTSNSTLFVYDSANGEWKLSIPADVVSAPNDVLPVLDGSNLTGVLLDSTLNDQLITDTNILSAKKTEEIATDSAVSMSIALG